MQQPNRIQQRGQGEVRGIGGVHSGVGEMLLPLSSGSDKEDGNRRGGSALDNGAGVVGGKKGAGGANLLSHGSAN